MHFEKYQGTGNDFIIFNGLENKIEDRETLARKVCHRRFGIGADGMMIVENSNIADVRMDFFNSDGTVAPMCGNGIRCFAKYVFDNKIVELEDFTVETLAGVMNVNLSIEGGLTRFVTINMGKPEFETSKEDVSIEANRIINKKLTFDEEPYFISVITMGTLHSVVFVDDLKSIDVNRQGKTIESAPIFPKKINVNFAEVMDNENIKVVTYERGAGQTLSCGTGAAATAVVSALVKGTGNDINVHVLGGKLQIKQLQKEVYMTGPAELICRGMYNF
ncbi:diaminopimelate epimerase [Proteinivorax hydrogeniformans]|uniref:Diaminopimelate epimerase n=1 Tax=Proteinivorax hydrogeniformans TaxID=1826727 RepID=A0AAU8HQ17_9FIRM